MKIQQAIKNLESNGVYSKSEKKKILKRIKKFFHPAFPDWIEDIDEELKKGINVLDNDVNCATNDGGKK